MQIGGAVFLLMFVARLVTAGAPAFAGTASEKFSAAVEKIAVDAGADIGVAFAGTATYWQNSSRKYPLLSVFKLHVAAAVLDKAGRENIALDTELRIAPEELKENLYSPMLRKYGVHELHLPLRELLYYMVAESDNNACDILIGWLGGTENIETYVHRLGLSQTEIKATETEMNRDVMLQYANRAPLSEIIRLLQLIDGGKLFAPELHRELLAIMVKTSTGTDKIKKYLPSSVSVAHKTGSSSRLSDGRKIADNDVAIIKYDGKTYYLAVMVSDSYLSDKENAEKIASIASLVYGKETSGENPDGASLAYDTETSGENPGD